MATFGTKLLGELRALGEGAIGVTVGVVLRLRSTMYYQNIELANLGIALSAVGGVTALGSDLTELVLWEVCKVCGVGVGHVDGGKVGILLKVRECVI